MRLIMTKYQEMLRDTVLYAEDRNCLKVEFSIIRGNEFIIHSGYYDGEYIAYCEVDCKLLACTSISKFKPTKLEVCSTLEIYSRSEKSLKDLIRRNMKESV